MTRDGNGADCKSVGFGYGRFESYNPQFGPIAQLVRAADLIRVGVSEMIH